MVLDLEADGARRGQWLLDAFHAPAHGDWFAESWRKGWIVWCRGGAILPGYVYNGIGSIGKYKGERLYEFRQSGKYRFIFSLDTGF